MCIEFILHEIGSVNVDRFLSEDMMERAAASDDRTKLAADVMILVFGFWRGCQVGVLIE